MRSGFTLVEMLLVLALLVVGAAIASTGFSAGNERLQLRRAADKLADAWAEGRLRAIETGGPIVFRCRIGDSWGYLGTSETPVAEVGADVVGDVPADTDQSEVRVSESEDGCVLFKKLLVSDRPGEPAIGGGVREGSLSAMVIFYPDGATSDAEATLETEGGRSLLVTLRGLTGAVRVSEPTDDSRGA